MKGILLFIYITAAVAAHGQTVDTIYYDSAWKITTSKAKMAYYRVVQTEGKLFKVADYYKNGQLQMTGSYSSLQPEVQEGDFKYYDDKGHLNIERSYVADQMDGDYKRYYQSGKLHWQIHYKAGINDGEFLVLYENGNVRRRDEYVNGGLTSGKCYTADGKDTTYYPYEVQPTFKGGQDSLMRYLEAHTPHVNSVVDGEGNNLIIVNVGFVVDEQGNIHDVRASKEHGASYEEKAMETVKAMPAWNPGSQDGKITKMPVTIPVRFGK